MSSSPPEDDRLEERWIDIQRRIVALWKGGSLDDALSEASGFLAEALPQAMEAQVLGFRAETLERMGRKQAALTELLAGRDRAAEGSYSRYTFELSLGRLSAEMGQRDEAASWYRAAMLTALKAEAPLSGGSALFSLLRLRGPAALGAEERQLAHEVATVSWKRLGLAGAPALGDLPAVAACLLEAESRPR